MSAEGEPPAKKTRKRSREASEETAAGEKQETPKYQRGDVWFDDGNIVLIASVGTAFRVYKGILSQHSEVFRDMFAVPQPPDAEKWEDCPVVHLADTAVDLHHILTVLYDAGGKHGMYALFTTAMND